MKYIIILILLPASIHSATAQEPVTLNGVTFGFGIGWSFLTNKPSQYFLTSDASHKLQIQEIGKSSLVISSLVSVKFGSIALQQIDENGTTARRIVNRKKIIVAPSADYKAAIVTEATHEKATFWQRLALNVAFNLAEINSGDVAFNKSIDGGIGLGYYANDFTQVALFFDMIRYRQMRDYYVEKYKDQSVPNGNEILNALDESNNNMFYNKYLPGVSLKIIFSLGNK